MNPTYYLLAVGIILVSPFIPYSMLRARRSKEKVYYMSGVVGALTLLFFISILFQQIVFAIVFVTAAFMLSVISFPLLNTAFQREADKQRREKNFTEPLKAQELLTWSGWYKIAFRRSIPKTMTLYLAFNMGIIIPSSLALSIAGVTTTSFVIFLIIAAIVVVIFMIQLYQPLKKNSLQTTRKHRKRAAIRTACLMPCVLLPKPTRKTCP